MFCENDFQLRKGRATIVIQESNIHNSVMKIDGYKHSMVQIISLAIALKLCITISNPPLVSDTYVFAEIVRALGGKFIINTDKLFIDARSIRNTVIQKDLGKMIHGSMYLCPALLMALGSFDYFGSGGCLIGDNEGNNRRPIKHVLSAMTLMGAHITEQDDKIHGEIERVSNLDEVDIMQYSTAKDYLSGPLVGGATKVFLIMSLKKSHFVIKNAYLKTDVMDMIRFLSVVEKKLEFIKMIYSLKEMPAMMQ